MVSIEQKVSLNCGLHNISKCNLWQRLSDDKYSYRFDFRKLTLKWVLTVLIQRIAVHR